MPVLVKIVLTKNHSTDINSNYTLHTLTSLKFCLRHKTQNYITLSLIVKKTELNTEDLTYGFTSVMTFHILSGLGCCHVTNKVQGPSTRLTL